MALTKVYITITRVPLTEAIANNEQAYQALINVTDNLQDLINYAAEKLDASD